MTKDEAIKIIQTEMECVSRPDCDRLACAYCDLAMRAEDVLTAYQMAITALQTDGDTISRADAIRVASGYCHPANIAKELANLPSVQPEKLTDKEQRIFLSAMGREEEVCKEVDDSWRDCREPYEDSLVHVCKEIRRKVKGTLWT